LLRYFEVVERRGVTGARAGGLLYGHAAAGWLVLETKVIRSKVAAHQVVWLFNAARVRKGRQPSRHRRGPLHVFAAPLAAGELGVMGAAAASRAWPPALRELVAYLSSMLAVLLRHVAS